MSFPTHWLNTMKVRFPNLSMTMLEPGKDYGKNVAVFKVPMKTNKKMIKNYLEQLYGLKIIQVKTMIYQGHSKRGLLGQPIKVPDWKKALVFLDGQEWRFPSLSEQRELGTPASEKEKEKK